MAGETDLVVILENLTVATRPGTFAVTRADGPVALGDGVAALIGEPEGVTVVAERDVAQARGWDVAFEAAWLTLDVHTSLDAVGVTAAVATALAARGIPCNVLAGYFHDHLLVPTDRVDDAIDCLRTLRSSGGAA